MKTQNSDVRSGWQIFRWPLLVNLIALTGVISALLGNGGADLLSWLCLGSSAGLIIFFCFNSADQGLSKGPDR